MISIDRQASTSVHDQLLEQLRYQIASGQYKVDDTLPSTRRLADQLGISFHTVRKVYQELDREGLLASRPGKGYVVVERVPLTKGERMERGAAVVQDSLQKLIGLGLEDAEVEYLFHEQMNLLEGAEHRHKVVVAAPYQEMAERLAEQVQSHLQRPVDACPLAALGRHQDADYVLASFRDLRQASEAVPRADVVGLLTYYRPEALGKVARLLEDKTLGIVTRYEDAVPPLMEALRTATGFSGPMIAASIDRSAKHLEQFVDDTDLLLYTPASRRRLLSFLDGARQHALIEPLIGRESLEMIRQTVPA